MGNKLCCDPAVTKYTQKDAIERSQRQIQQFLNLHQQIKQVCKTPTKIYGSIDNTTILDYQMGTYIGRQIDNKRNGLGVMLFKQQGIYYEGQWRDDKFNGKGFMAHNNGDFYNGQWKNGLPHGQGVYISSRNNWRYEGNWNQGFQHGKGQQLFEDGSVYKGQFKNGERFGIAKYQNSRQGYKFEGQVGADGPEGFATLQTDQYVYQGQWKKGQINGTGRSFWLQNGNTIYEYIGEYKQGQKHGFGEYHSKNNNKKFKGKWQNGTMTNTGVFIEGNK